MNTQTDPIAEAIVEDEKHRECVSALDCHLADPNGRMVVSGVEYECSRVQIRRPILAAFILAREGLYRITDIRPADEDAYSKRDGWDNRDHWSYMDGRDCAAKLARETLAAITPKDTDGTP